MHIRFRAVLICALVTLPLAAQAQTFPGADWQRKTPAEAGINPQLLKEADQSAPRIARSQRCLAASFRLTL